MGVEQRGDRLGRDQRHVAGEDEHRLGLLDQRQRRADRAAGAVGLGLLDRLDPLGEPGGDVAAGRDDRRDPPGAGLARGQDRPGDHRPPADGMQHLRRRGTHPRSRAGRHDQDQGGCHCPAGYCARAAPAPRLRRRARLLCRPWRPDQRPAGEDQVDPDQQADRPVGAGGELDQDQDPDDQAADPAEPDPARVRLAAAEEGDGGPGESHEQEVDPEHQGQREAAVVGLEDQPEADDEGQEGPGQPRQEAADPWAANAAAARKALAMIRTSR